MFCRFSLLCLRSSVPPLPVLIDAAVTQQQQQSNVWRKISLLFHLVRTIMLFWEIALCRQIFWSIFCLKDELRWGRSGLVWAMAEELSFERLCFLAKVAFFGESFFWRKCFLAKVDSWQVSSKIWQRSHSKFQLILISSVGYSPARSALESTAAKHNNGKKRFLFKHETMKLCNMSMDAEFRIFLGV